MGYYRDAETDLFYIRARFLDPYLSRSFTQDLLMRQHYLKLYLFDNNNPVSLTLFTNLVEIAVKELTLLADRTICNLSGNKPDKEVTNPNCDKHCTHKHEDVHVATLSKGCCVKGRKEYKACKTNKCRDEVISKWNKYITVSLGWFECPAYKAGKSCREKFWNNMNCDDCNPPKPKCCKEIQSGIDRDNTQIKRYCPGKEGKCPF